MGIREKKWELRERIISYQYHLPTEDIWELLDRYDHYLESEGTQDELAEAAFFRGEASFRMGRYHDTVAALTKSLRIGKTPEYVSLEADAYNMLGMLFAFVGYETIALDNYLSAVSSAQRNRNLQGQVAALLNVGVLYQGLGDYRKAMSYYKKAYDVANKEYGTPELMLVLLSWIQQAQVLFKMRRFDEAKRMKREIDSYYQVITHDEMILSKHILDVWYESRFGAESRVQELIEEIRQFLIRDTEYLEQIDFYVDFCGFLMEDGRKTDARQFLDLLTEKLGATEFLHLRMRMEEMEVQYQRKYNDQAHYYEACLHYMNLQQEYERTLKLFKQRNLVNIESLQELERQRQEFEFRSKCDLATGLLNKDTFRYEVENYLNERNRDISDAMVVVDIDDFKLVNDSYGHLVGDEVIVKLSTLLKEQFAEDLCGRFGGDEFVIFIRNVAKIEEVELRVEQFREMFSELGFGKNTNVHNTVSIGVSYNNGVNASYNSMFSCADEALLKAKEYGKNRVAFFEIKRGLLKYV